LRSCRTVRRAGDEGLKREYRPTWYTAGPTMHRAILTLLDGDRSGREKQQVNS